MAVELLQSLLSQNLSNRRYPNNRNSGLTFCRQKQIYPPKWYLDYPILTSIMSSKLATSLAVALSMGLVALPWLLGGNLPPVRVIAIGITGLLLLGVVCVPSLIGSPTRIGLLMKCVLLAGIGYAALQLLPSLAAHSSYPSASRARLCEVILGVGVFVAASSIFTKRKMVPYLFGLIAFNGVVLTFVGIAQTVSSSKKILGIYELINGGEPFGPFVNGNNAGGYLLMCFAAAIFFLARRVFQSQSPMSNSSEQGLGRPQKKRRMKEAFEFLGREFATLETKHLYAYAAIALVGAGIFATLSRGASVAFLIAAVVVWMFVFRKSWLSLAVTAVVIGSGIGFLVWSEQNEVVSENLSSLADLESASETRFAHWNDAWQAAQPSLALGNGLGTYAFTYPKFQTGHFNRWFKHAENQYFETLVELGFFGLGVLLLAIGITIYASLQLLKKPDSTTRAVGAVGLFAVISQTIAGALDFGLYQPANTVLMATLIGVVFAQHNWFWKAQNLTRKKTSRLRSSLGWLIALLMMGGAVWATYEYSAVDARRAARRFEERFDPARDEDKIEFYESLLDYALKIRPDDSEAHYQMALNQILQYRMAAAKGMMVPPKASEFEDGTLTPEQVKQRMEFVAQMQPKDINEAWPRTPLNAVHRLARIATKAGPEYIAEFSQSKEVQDYLSVAWHHLNLAEEHSDRLWVTQIRLAQLSCLMGYPGRQKEHCEIALQRCPNNSKSLYVVGLLEHQSDDSESAYEHWNKCLVFSREFERPIIQLCRYEIGMKSFFEQVIPNDAYYRLKIAKRYFDAPEDLMVKRLLLNHTRSLLEPNSQTDIPSATNDPISPYSDTERNYLIGQIELDSKNYPVASLYFRKALESEKDRVEWRLQYARSLIAETNYTEAISQLKICQLSGEHKLLTTKLLSQANRRRNQKRK